MMVSTHFGILPKLTKIKNDQWPIVISKIIIKLCTQLFIYIK